MQQQSHIANDFGQRGKPGNKKKGGKKKHIGFKYDQAGHTAEDIGV